MTWWGNRADDFLSDLRKRNEEIIIGDGIVVKVVEIRGDKIRIAVEAPKEMTVHRKEYHDAIRQSQAIAYFEHQVMKTFAPIGNMQLMRFKAATEFCCSRCKTFQKAKLAAIVAGDWNQLVCNGCYGKLLSEENEEC